MDNLFNEPFLNDILKETTSKISNALSKPMRKIFAVNGACGFAFFMSAIAGFPMGAKVIEDMANPYVMRVLELSRKVDNESHLFCGFVRFFDLGKIT